MKSAIIILKRGAMCIIYNQPVGCYFSFVYGFCSLLNILIQTLQYWSSTSQTIKKIVASLAAAIIHLFTVGDIFF